MTTSNTARDNVSQAASSAEGSAYNMVDPRLMRKTEALLTNNVAEFDKWGQQAIYGSFKSKTLATLAHAIIELHMLNWNQTEEEFEEDSAQRQENGEVPKQQQYLERRVREATVLAEYASAIAPRSIASSRDDYLVTLEYAFKSQLGQLEPAEKLELEAAESMSFLDEYQGANWDALDSVLSTADKAKVRERVAEELEAKREALIGMRETITNAWLDTVMQFGKQAHISDDVAEIEFTLAQCQRIAKVVGDKCYNRLEKLAEQRAEYLAGDMSKKFLFTGKTGKNTLAEAMLMKHCEQEAVQLQDEIEAVINSTTQGPIDNSVH